MQAKAFGSIGNVGSEGETAAAAVWHRGGVSAILIDLPPATCRCCLPSTPLHSALSCTGGCTRACVQVLARLC
jgi:hypothetical protein